MKWILWLVLALPGITAQVAANEEGIIVRSAVVYEQSSSLSRRVGEIRAGSQVSIFSRQGGWKEIYSENPPLIGWVRGYQVREGEYAPAIDTTSSESDSRGFLSGLASLSRKASSFFRRDSSSTSSGTATIGVRGLSEAELRGAVADFAELEKMNGFASNSGRAGSFAARGKLKAQKISHLKAR